MDAIKKFFEKKKADTKFKVAGEGRRLESSSHAMQSGQRRFSSQDRHHRQDPSYEARRAGAAALARVESSKPTEVNWSLQAIKAKARRQLEAEQKALAQLKLGDTPEDGGAGERQPTTVTQDAAPMLAVREVYFSCPLIGPELGTYEETKMRIQEFLYNQMDEDLGISACLMIHTCNKNKEKVKVCVETLCKYIENIVSNPTEEKFQKIRLSNKAFQERVAPIEGTQQFLQAAGFTINELPFNDTTESFWVFSDASEEQLNALEQLRDALVSAEPIKPQLDRSTQVLLPAEAAKYTDLPPEFFNLTVEELKKEQQLRTDAVERNMMLRTKAMREREELREMRKYRFALIRIRFPDGLILQGTFYVYEKFGNVLLFIRENLVQDWRPFILNLSGGGKIDEEEQSLVELRLVPAVLLNFSWDPSIQDPSLEDNVFLKQETMMLLRHDS
ncbi:UBX domain-containing protein 6-like [Oratosquilla oratoria]|uniref:UBX domain-containing protein 6-like n=1 Tax=Oratosquilla oratoria TaxID=337810 RepID=UPI003F76F930